MDAQTDGMSLIQFQRRLGQAPAATENASGNASGNATANVTENATNASAAAPA